MTKATQVPPHEGGPGWWSPGLAELGKGSVEVQRDGEFIRLIALVDGEVVAELRLSDATAKHVAARLLQEAE
jgi:hypothetical protein